MHFLRHVLAITLIFGFAYLYFEKQRSPGYSEMTLTEKDPFSGWDHVEEAPAFNTAAEQKATTEAPKTSPVPQPIPFSVAGHGELIADLTQYSEKSSDILSQTLQQTQELANKGTTPADKKSPSLWQEPGAKNQADKNSAPTQKVTQPSTAVVAKEPQKPEVAPAKPADPKQTTPAPSQPKTELVEKAPAVKQSPETTPRPYREFVLGTGEQVTVCVLEKSVSQDGLLLSTIFAGLRREWSSEVSRSREQSLILLVADAQQTVDAATEQKMLQTRLQQLQPVRVVSVVQGNETRGSLRFSSEAESISALMSVPGIYKILAETSAQEAKGTSEYPIVQVELPRELATQETATVRLLSAALQGNWEAQQNLSYTGQALSSMAKPAAENADQQDTTSSFFKKLYDNTLGKNNAPSTPAPPQKPDENFLTMFLGESAPWPQEMKPSAPVSKNPSKELATNQVVPNPIERPVEPTPADKPAALPPAKVEFLDPPPEYSPRSSQEKSTPVDFYKLPPPPR